MWPGPHGHCGAGAPAGREQGAGAWHRLRAAHSDHTCDRRCAAGSGPRTRTCQQSCPATRKWPLSTHQPWWSWGSRVRGTEVPTAWPGGPRGGGTGAPCSGRAGGGGTALAPRGAHGQGAGILHERKLQWPRAWTAQGGRSQSCLQGWGARRAEGRG